MSAPYRADLAWIHHTGFGEFAISAAPGVLAILARHGVTTGTIVDAGCGSGLLSRAVIAAGFDVHGFDASSAMIALARETAPEASFSVASFASASLPPCDAVVAIGEVLNYGSLDELRRFVEHAREAIRPGGVLLFDVAESGAYPPFDEVRLGGDDWSVIAIKECDGNHLTRRVMTFREIGGRVQRDEETHTLELYGRGDVLRILRENEFRATVRRSYGTRRLPKGHAVYVAKRVLSS